MKRSAWPMMNLYGSFSRLAAESQSVVGLRMLKAFQGGPDWPMEARLMVEEKAKAAMDAQTLLFTSLITGTAATAPTRAVALYRRRVNANRRRLSRDI